MFSNDNPSGDENDKSPKMSKTPQKVFALLIVIIIISGIIGLAYHKRMQISNLKWLQALFQKDTSHSKVVYYCPMHPQYKSDKPGTCPICNMNLEKMEPEKSETAPKEPSAVERAGSTGKRKILYWQDAMNPGYKSDKPGKAPDGMDLVPVYADEAHSEAIHNGALKVSPQKQQLIGVQYGEVTEQPISKTIRAIGRITYNETKIARIQTKVDGWIERVFVDFTGDLVKRGQPLISIYSPQLVSTQQELLIAKKSKDILGTSPFKDASEGSSSLYEATLQRLRLLDISDAQIKAIERTGVPSRALTLAAPINGFVLTRNAFPGQRITPDTELYTIADLGSVWVMADIYEYEASMVHVGQAGSMSLTYLPGKTFRGKVNYIYPDLDKTTRTLKVRLEFPNADFSLKPDMFANVELRINFGKQVSIPETAVMDSGSEQIVFVALKDGYFETRKVKLGARVDHQCIVLSGLSPGEKVVTSGNFLIDSESQLRSAMETINEGEHAAGPEGGTHDR